MNTPDDWNISPDAVDYEGVCDEDVPLQSEEGITDVIAATNETPKQLYVNVARMDLGENWEWSKPTILGYEKIGDVECCIYAYKEEVIYYSFQKNGTAFLVVCPIEDSTVAEDIIKSIKAKK